MRSSHPAFRTASVLALIGLTSFAAACSSDSGSDASSSTGTDSASSSAMPDAFPVTVTGGNGEVTIDEQPEQIISLSPTATEMLFEVGAGPQVLAVDDQSNYPDNAPVSDLSGFQPNAEAIAAKQPDLVLLSNDSNGIVAALEKLNIKTLVLPAAATVDGAMQQMVTVGEATGHKDDAQKAADKVSGRIADAVASVPRSAQGASVYHELSPDFYSLTSETFAGDIYTQFGLTNIADAAEGAAAAGGYPQLSSEYIVKQGPDLIVLADVKCCQQNAETVAKRPGFAKLSAVKSGGVIELDDDIASRWGPRMADFAEAVAAGINKTASAG